MGLIHAALGAATGNLADQWKEYFVCESMPSDVLMTRGQKRGNVRSSNRYSSDNIITTGSGIVVADGQCMIIVDDGKIVEICAEPGKFTYDASTEPSVFVGDLKQGIKDSLLNMLERLKYGGMAGHDQRVYYFNTKEILGNKFGTPNPIPFRVFDRNLGLDIDVSVRCSGTYSYKITDPVLFYTNIAGNVTQDYTREMIDGQLKSEFISALQPVFGQMSMAGGIRPSELPAHVTEICKLMNDTLSPEWANGRGIEVCNVSINSVTLPEEDAEMIKHAQKAAIYKDTNMAGAAMVEAQAEAMKTAAGNENGAMAGFMGMGMAMNAGGMNAQNLFAMGQQQPQQPAQAGGWTCSCGTVNQGNFCSNCGQPKPQVQAGGFCSNCGAQLAPEAKFCPNCGTPTGK